MVDSALPAATLEAYGSGCERKLRVEDDGRGSVCVVSPRLVT
jgi:hypothetical protein